MKELTKRQTEVLNYVKKFMVSHGYPPTVREIGKALGISSPATIQSHLVSLQNKGYIVKGNKMNRAIELKVPNEYAEKDENVVDVPLLGKVTAGNPIDAIEQPNEYFSLPVSLIPKGAQVFTLKVSGESMINAGIFDGDIVIVEKQATAHNGEIVVAMNDENQATVKRFYKEDGYFRLQPENDTFKPIILKNVTILGKVVGLYRTLK